MMAWRRGQTSSQDLRVRVLAAYELTTARRAPHGSRWASPTRSRRDGTVPGQGRWHRGRRSPVWLTGWCSLRAAIQERPSQVPDATLAERRDRLSETHGVVMVWKTLTRADADTVRRGRSSRCALPPERAEYPPSWTPC